MSKMRLIIAFLLFMPFCLHPQQVVKYTFEICEDDGCQDNQNRFLYFTIMDSVVGKGVIKENGMCSIYQSKDIDKENINVTIRQNESCIGMVGLQRLIDYNRIVDFAKMGDKLIDIDSVEELGSISKYKGKSFLRVFTKEDYISQHGAESWYFPTETLKFPRDYYYNRLVKDTSFMDDFCFLQGHYPNQQELDSIISISSQQSAENDVGWCSENLLGLSEPNFSNGYDKNVFRLTWISSYNQYLYDPYSIRIEMDVENNPIMHLSCKMFDFCGDKIIICKIIPMTDSEYQKFLYLVDEYHYWELPSRVDQGEGESEFAFSILEGIFNGRYHVIYRDAKRDKGMMKIRKFLWDLTGFGENKIVHKRQRIE